MRELYAVSEVAGRSILLLYESRDKKLKALKIEPVIRENENESLILFYTCSREGPCFIRIEGSLEDFDVEIINAGHTKCLDKRFRNSFEEFHTSYLLKDKEWYSTPEFKPRANGTETNIFSLCSQLIYGDKETAVAIRELVTMHVTTDDFRDVYKQFVDVEAYLKNEYRTIMAIPDEKKRKQKNDCLTEKAFKKHLATWEFLTLEDFIAIASVYNTEVFVLPNENTGEKLFLPICGNFMFVFKSPLVFKQVSKVGFQGGLQDRECPCLTDIPKLRGNFPICDDEIDLHRLKKLGNKNYTSIIHVYYLFLLLLEI
jgi:hypothetical protein